MLQGPPGGKAAPAEVVTTDPQAPPVDPKARIARVACGAVLFAVAGTEFVSVVLTRDLVVASLWTIFGFGALGTGVYLYKGRFTAWGTAMILDVFALFLALATVNLLVLGALIASFVVLYVFRLPFGVGAWKIERSKDNDRNRAMIRDRTRNAAGVHCPKCGADTLWVAADGSTFCLTCRAGTIELGRREPS